MARPALPTSRTCPISTSSRWPIRAGDKVTLFGVNRNLTADIPSTIKLAGFSAHAASGKLLAAESIYVGNDDAQPEAVVPQDIKLPVGGSVFLLHLP